MEGKDFTLPCIQTPHISLLYLLSVIKGLVTSETIVSKSNCGLLYWILEQEKQKGINGKTSKLQMKALV